MCFLYSISITFVILNSIPCQEDKIKKELQQNIIKNLDYISPKSPKDSYMVGSLISFSTVNKFISAFAKIRADYNYILNQQILAVCQIIHIAWLPYQTINYHSDESIGKSLFFTLDHSFCNLAYYQSRALGKVRQNNREQFLVCKCSFVVTNH